MEEVQEKRADAPQMNSREWLWKTLKPAGCVFVLILAVLMILTCFSAGKDPIKGYAPPESGEYYAGHLDELKAELEARVFPALEGVEACRVTGDTLTVEMAHDRFVVNRSALLRYFDEELFTLVQLD